MIAWSRDALRRIEAELVADAKRGQQAQLTELSHTVQEMRAEASAAGEASDGAEDIRRQWEHLASLDVAEVVRTGSGAPDSIAAQMALETLRNDFDGAPTQLLAVNPVLHAEVDRRDGEAVFRLSISSALRRYRPKHRVGRSRLVGGRPAHCRVSGSRRSWNRAAPTGSQLLGTGSAIASTGGARRRCSDFGKGFATAFLPTYSVSSNEDTSRCSKSSTRGDPAMTPASLQTSHLAHVGRRLPIEPRRIDMSERIAFLGHEQAPSVRAHGLSPRRRTCIPGTCADL